jgi:hypothetical protein
LARDGLEIEQFQKKTTTRRRLVKKEEKGIKNRIGKKREEKRMNQEPKE